MQKKIDKNYIFLALIVSFLITFIIGQDYLFGSKTDWINQHTVFPDYFRKLFYQTGNLIPSFAPQIGAGQNIFYFSYYGLLNPLILISYVLPMIPMTNYIIIINIILIFSTTFLLYYYLKHHVKDTNGSFISTILVLMSASFLFQFQRHFMFVSYMPFFIIGLIGIDIYFKNGTKWIYTLATFFMIMTSYYYSIIGILLFILYGIYNYIKKTNKFYFKSFFKEQITFFTPILIGILMSGVLLCPTIYTILSSRSTSNVSLTITDLLIPKLNMGAVLYDNYSLGLTSISIISCIYLLINKKLEFKFLVTICFTIIFFPIFIYLLNGTLYIRNKVFIPFLPIFALFIAYFLKDLFSRKILTKSLINWTLIFSILFYITGYHNNLFYFDIILMLICILIYKKLNWDFIIKIPLLIIALINFFCANYNTNLVSKEFYEKVFSDEADTIIHNVLQKENDIVRFNYLDNTLYNVNKIYNTNYYQTSLYSSTYHNGYNKFYKNVSNNSLPYRNKLILAQTDNIMFQTLMGVKYILSSHTPSIGYNEVTRGKENKKLVLYENRNVLPIGYASTNLISSKIFNFLSYPQTFEVLLTNIIIDKNIKSNYQYQIKPFQSNYTYQKDKSLSISEAKDGYIINAKEKANLTIQFPNNFDQEILFLQFDLANQHNCNVSDQQIIINNIGNKLTCKEWLYKNNNHTFHYVLSQNTKWNKLNITFSKGSYEIKNIKLHTLNYNYILETISNVDTFVIDKNKTKGNNIIGSIDVKEDGYFVTSIPYDKGFNVSMDNEKINYEKVNDTFLGFPIKKGNHDIKITYKSPYLSTGYIVSQFGFISFIIIIYQDYKKLNKKGCI